MEVFRQRLQNVQEDVARSLENLSAVLDHLSVGGVSASLRLTISNNVIVALVSIAEEGLRECAIEYLGFLERNAPSYDYVPQETHSSNIAGLIGTLNDFKKSKPTSDIQSLYEALGRVADRKDQIFLDKPYIANNQGNFRSKEVTGLMSRLGISGIWELVAQTKIVENKIPSLSTSSLIINEWNSVFDERDTIVHRFSQANGWGDTIIRSAILLFESTFDAICFCCSESAESYTKSTCYIWRTPR